MNETELLRRFPNASRSTIERNRHHPKLAPDGAVVCPTKPKRTEGVPLERPAPGKVSSSTGATGCDTGERYRVTFRVFAVRPLDWDNYRLKDLQDCLVRAKLLPDDNWRILEGTVISGKAHSKEEERTEIEITRIA